MISSDSTNKQLNRIKVKEDRVKLAVYCSLHHENPDGSAFCDECGESLPGAAPERAVSAPSQPAPAPTTTGTHICPWCGAGDPAGDSFWSNCGGSLLGSRA